MPKNSHTIAPEELMAYLDGELPFDEAASASEHLEHCRECQDFAADFQVVSDRMLGWQVEPTDLVITADILAALDQRKEPPKASGFGQIAWRWKWAWGGAVAIVLMLMMALPKMNYQPASVLRARSQLWHSGEQASAVDLVRTKNSLIVRTADLILTTKEFDKARNSLEDILKKYHGYLGKLNISTPSEPGRILEATLRVPADQRDAAISEIRKLGRVESESYSGEEVTKEYVDLEARLSNDRNAERRMTDLLRQRTGKLSDVLEVEREIERVRGQTERMEAEKKDLLNRVEFTILNVKITEDYKAQLQFDPDSVLGRVRNAAVDGYHRIVEGTVAVVLFLLSYGPSLLICAGILFFPVRMIWRRRDQLMRTTE